jgi:DNA-directed RNA polymerase I, II, and III subunit RPABC3
MLFEDTFRINEVDPNGRKFDKVSRISASGQNYEDEVVLDYNCSIYSLKNGEKFNLALCETLSLTGEPDSKVFNQSAEPTLADQYEYVMHGTIFEIKEVGDGLVNAYISFGGLLMSLRGDEQHLKPLRSTFLAEGGVYLLIRKARK